jgi:ABC-2 type transport system ATP-binding protein
MDNERTPEARNEIVIEDLAKSFGDVKAVNGLTLNIRKGEMFGFLGPNGAGKTTTISMLCGLLEPTAGSAQIGGFDIGKEPQKVKALIGVCPQEVAVFKFLTGMENLELMIALISDPEIVFLDEPTVGMDARARRRTWQYISSLKEQGKTVILTTHYIEEAQALSDRVGIIDYGELIALGSPEELMKKHEASDLEAVFLQITGRRIAEGS